MEFFGAVHRSARWAESRPPQTSKRMCLTRGMLFQNTSEVGWEKKQMFLIEFSLQRNPLTSDASAFKRKEQTIAGDFAWISSGRKEVVYLSRKRNYQAVLITQHEKVAAASES